jgi:chemotaxis protein CheD
MMATTINRFLSPEANALANGLELDELTLKYLPKATVLTTGQMAFNNKRSLLFQLDSVSSGLVVVLYDSVRHVGGVAYTLLPDSTYIEGEVSVVNRDALLEEAEKPAKFANLALPVLWEGMGKLGAQASSTTARIIGGSQLFTFGGGGGNPLNVGSRNAIACRTHLSKLGIVVDKTDVGGNRPRSLLFALAEGQVWVLPKAGKGYLL